MVLRRRRVHVRGPADAAAGSGHLLDGDTGSGPHDPNQERQDPSRPGAALKDFWCTRGNDSDFG